MKSIEALLPSKDAAPADVAGTPAPARTARQGTALRKAATDLLYDDVKPAAQGSGADQVCEAPRKRARRTLRAVVPAPLPPVRAAQPEPLIDSGDKLHRVAVVANVFIEPLRAPRLGRTALVPPPRPRSKAECERRCGSDGFCDPSDPVGCGGMFCGRPRPC